MATKLKVTVTLQQQRNPHYIARETEDQVTPEEDRNYKSKLDREGKDWRHPYLYLVVQLKNAMEPGIGEVITKTAVQGLIDGGVEVTINPLK